MQTEKDVGTDLFPVKYKDKISPREKKITRFGDNIQNKFPFICLTVVKRRFVTSFSGLKYSSN